jgi:hypothetical protein
MDGDFLPAFSRDMIFCFRAVFFGQIVQEGISGMEFGRYSGPVIFFALFRICSYALLMSDVQNKAKKFSRIFGNDEIVITFAVP